MAQPIIDVHAHLYSADEDRYRPITGARFPPSGSCGLEHLRRICAENNVDRVCAIQTGSFYRHDNEYVCDVAAANSNWIAGICMIDPEHPNGPSVLSELVRSYGDPRSQKSHDERGAPLSPDRGGYVAYGG